MKFIYKRIVIKISGEVIKGINQNNFHNCVIYNIMQDIKYLIQNGIEISIVIGGGNLFRGLSLSNLGIHRVDSDHIGMLSTIINGIFLKDLFKKLNISTCLISSIDIDNICQKFHLETVMNLLSKSIVIIFCGGLGVPFFTTDTTACIRAIETNSDIILKGTKVNGVYSQDPKKYTNVILYHQLNYQYVLQKEFKIMDMTAFILARDYNIPINVFNIYNDHALKYILKGKQEGTLINNTTQIIK